MKKNIIKAISICALGLLALTYAGCSDMLDQEPQGKWKDKENPDGSFQTDIFTLYAKIRGWGITSGLPALAVHNLRCEDIEKGSTNDDGVPDSKIYDDFYYNASEGFAEGYWKDHYGMIHTANKVIDEMKEYEKDIALKGEVLSENDLINNSEAHFFRAFGYFNLVRAFGEVPLIDFKVVNAHEGNIAKSEISKIYELIDADLTIAEEHLPEVWDQKFIGRLTWGAARSLHARTYMMRNDWANMYKASTDVINSNIYNLDTPYDQIFRETGENCSESIFELQCTATSALAEESKIGSEYAKIQGVRGDAQWNLGWGWHTPTEELANAFEANDPRKDETLLYFYKSEAEAQLGVANKPYGEKPIAMGTVIAKYYNKKVYTNPALRAQYAKTGYWVNIRIIRLSDVVLMAAEAANELGQTNDALANLEKVRARARGNDATIVLPVTTTNKDQLRDAIRHERRVELAMEWDRFYDLVRWGIARQVMHAAGKTNYQDKHKYLPIPQKEIDNSNGILIQNPNY